MKKSMKKPGPKKRKRDEAAPAPKGARETDRACLRACGSTHRQAVPRSSRSRARVLAVPTARRAQSKIEHDLRERVKELRCLYGVAQLVEKCDGSADRLMQGVVDLLPPSWQYPEVACARIAFDKKRYLSAGFVETPYRQSAEIAVAGETAGAVEVFYREEMPESDEGPFLEEERALIDAVAERLGRTAEHFRAEAERARIEHDLGERVKELRCLYGIAELEERCSPAAAGEGSLDRLMQGVADLLPPSWQYPEVACARVVFDEREYITAGFRETHHRQAADIRVAGRRAGTVEVFYLKRMPGSDEGPFLKEERALIDAVADRLGRTAERFGAEEELRRAHGQLQVERRALQEANSALRTVLARIEDEKSSIKQAVVANVEKILLPILHALEVEVGPDQKGYVRLLRRNLEEIASPLVDRLSRRLLALTPAEIGICNMIRMGLGSKEIAQLRHVAPATVSRQRDNIRRKLGLTGKSVNLATYLQTFGASLPRQGLPGPAERPSFAKATEGRGRSRP
jgi:DNA-binding CsgD family transcriptional regulator